VGRDFGVATVTATNHTPSGAQTGEELFHVSRAGNFRVRRPSAFDRVSITTADSNLAQPRGEPLGLSVLRREHLPVACLKAQDGSKPMKIRHVAASGKAGEDVVQGVEQAPLTQIGKKGDKIAAPAGDLSMVALGNAVHT